MKPFIGSIIRCLAQALLAAGFFLLASATVYAGTVAAPTDRLVQCDINGVVTNNAAITDVRLPIVFDANPGFFPISVDAAIFANGVSVKELTGLFPDSGGNLIISLGAVTNFHLNTVYEIKYRGHYGIVGDDTVVVEAWRSAGLYFKVWRVTGTINGGGGVPVTPVAPVTPADPVTPAEPAAPPVTAYQSEVTAQDGTEATLPIMVDKDAGTAFVDASPKSIAQNETVITLPYISGVNTYTVGILLSELLTDDIQGTLTINTAKGSIVVPSNMLTGILGISGSNVKISISEGNKDNLPEDVRAAIGDRPLIQLKLSLDGERIDWSNPNAAVTVSIPYTPTAAELENPESIVVWFIDGTGKAVSIPNGRYDLETGMVIFSTTHFSYYAVAYNKVSFNDVAPGAWYSKAVSFIAARNITTGTGNGNYSPKAKLTRGEYIVLVMRAYRIAPDENATDNFADAGNTYYTGYLAAARRLRISAGVGNNMFAPGREITRQEMFTLLFNALKVIRQLPQGISGKTLSDFTDAGQIDAWAKEALSFLVKHSVVDGYAGKLSPAHMSTRAEMAQVLYNLLGK